MGITDPNSLDIINKAIRKVKGMPIDISSYTNPSSELDAYLTTIFADKTYYKGVLDSWNETLRFFDMFEGRNHLKRSVSLALVPDTINYEVNEANFAADFSIEKILEDEVQTANGGFCRKMTRAQYIKYVIPFNVTRKNNFTITADTAPRLWASNVISDDDGNPVTYFLIYPGVTTAQNLFIPYTRVMTEEIDDTTVLDPINVPLNDIEPLVYYLAWIIATNDTKPQLPQIAEALDAAMLQSSIAHKWLDESDEADLSRGMVQFYHGGL